MHPYTLLRWLCGNDVAIDMWLEGIGGDVVNSECAKSL